MTDIIGIIDSNRRWPTSIALDNATGPSERPHCSPARCCYGSLFASLFSKTLVFGSVRLGNFQKQKTNRKLGTQLLTEENKPHNTKSQIKKDFCFQRKTVIFYVLFQLYFMKESFVVYCRTACGFPSTIAREEEELSSCGHENLLRRTTIYYYKSHNDTSHAPETKGRVKTN